MPNKFRITICLGILVVAALISQLIPNNSVSGDRIILASAQSQLSEGKQNMNSKIAESNNKLAYSLFQEFRKDSDSFSFSPTSIANALALLLVGADTDTAPEIASALNFVDLDTARSAPFAQYRRALEANKDIALTIGNSLWSERSIELANEFVESAKKLHDAKIDSLDFKSEPEQSRKTINAWVNELSKGMINELFAANSISAETRLVVANVVYFKGIWSTPFEKTSTSPGKFHANQDSSSDAQFMNQSGFYDYAESSALKLLGIPYAGKTSSLYIAVPKERFGLADIEVDLDKEIEKLLSTKTQRLGNISVPRFKSDSRPDLQKALTNLGVRTAFSKNADFSRVTKEENEYYVSKAVHQSVVEVNEEGTEASAATGFATATSAAMDSPFEFRADQPFVFFIYDEVNKSILFIGRVATI